MFEVQLDKPHIGDARRAYSLDSDIYNLFTKKARKEWDEPRLEETIQSYFRYHTKEYKEEIDWCNKNKINFKFEISRKFYIGVFSFESSNDAFQFKLLFG